MIDAAGLKKSLCSTFCNQVNVSATPCGYAVSSPFRDDCGDPITFYLRPAGERYMLDDDGSFLSDLVARDISIHEGQRRALLLDILREGGAELNSETLEIHTGLVDAADVPARAISLLSALIRVRDLALLAKEVVRSTFREDALKALTAAMGHAATLIENAPFSEALAEYPADLIIRPSAAAPQGRAAALYFVTNSDKLNEALLLRLEAAKLGERLDVVALLERMNSVNERRLQRALNRGVTVGVFREDQIAAIDVVRERLNIPAPRAFH
jgi:hypothetical protein